MAVGLGYDIHAFGGDGVLRLGGIDIDDAPAVVAHSDGDVLIHAIVDALLGAIGEGDIGTLFPDDSAENENRDSTEFLREAVSRVRVQRKIIVNVDCVVSLEKPKLAPYVEKIKVHLSSIIDGPVNVKAKTGEGLGAIGRNEGVACWAVAQVEPFELGAK